MGKWFLEDWRAPQRVVVGTLTDVHITSGIFSDGDTNIVIEPKLEFQQLLINRFGKTNENGKLECEVNVKSDWRDLHMDWVSSLTQGEVTAQGVWVDDNEHDGGTELHPMDVIFGTVTGSKIPGDWINTLASERGLEVNTSMLAFRFAAASDVRGDVFNPETPPLSEWTRPTTFRLEYPPRPAESDKVPIWEQRSSLMENASIDFAPRDDGGKMVLDVTVTCLGRDYGGPGVLLGEIVTYWSSPPPDPCPALLKQIQKLEDKLDEEPGPDVNERKKIIQKIDELRKKALNLGCVSET